MTRLLAFLFTLATATIGSASTGPAWAADLPVLNVYTYSSFTADWGPGPAIKKAFEAQCGCKVNFVTAEDGVVLWSRLRLEGANSKADVVIGLDTNLTAEAGASGLFAPAEVKLDALKLPIAWDDRYFVPFDFGYFAFVYDKTKLPNPPKTLADLVNGHVTGLALSVGRSGSLASTLAALCGSGNSSGN